MNDIVKINRKLVRILEASAELDRMNSDDDLLKAMHVFNLKYPFEMTKKSVYSRESFIQGPFHEIAEAEAV